MEVKLRKANKDDAMFLFGLRNTPEIFRFFSNPNPVPWEEHLDWLDKVFSGEARKHLFVVEFQKKPVGQARLDETTTAKKAIISISLVKDLWGRGLSSLILRQALLLAKELGFEKILAEIHQQNIASEKLFQKNNFQFQSQNGIWLNYELKL